MRNFVLAAVAAVFLSGCDVGNLGFYLYPQVGATGVTEDRSTGPLAGLEVVGYLPTNKLSGVDPAQTRHLTDLVYFTLSPRSDGTLNHAVLSDSHRDFLRKVRRDYGVRVLMGVTDHSREGALATVAANPGLRSRFAANLTDFLITEGFDGADFDWEYPRPGSLDEYAALLQDVQRLFGPRGLKLTVAVSPSQPLTADAYAAVDRVHAMMYDDFGRHATFEKATDHVESLVAGGADRSKVLLGLPFYGRGYTRSGPAWSNAMSYKKLRELYAPGPSQDTVSGYYFNGIDTIRKKVQFAKAAGLSGVMIWEIGQDTEDDASLLAAITHAREDLAKAN